MLTENTLIALPEELRKHVNGVDVYMTDQVSGLPFTSVKQVGYVLEDVHVAVHTGVITASFSAYGVQVTDQVVPIRDDLGLLKVIIQPADWETAKACDVVKFAKVVWTSAFLKKLKES
jgi:hypothetical protein